MKYVSNAQYCNLDVEKFLIYLHKVNYLALTIKQLITINLSYVQ